MRTPTPPELELGPDVELVGVLERIARDLERVTIVLGLVVGLNIAGIALIIGYAK